METLLHDILSKIVDHPDSISLTREEDDFTIRINLTAHEDDYPKIIGKNGSTIKALTEILRLYDIKMNKDSQKKIFINAAS
ncbi:hypothetical protein A3D06_01840 [Candidatus Roizmanbacteria bacterium RIFCSPHIGHO2_02_FULL_40_9]|uniref:Uncharacterized protein n=2 Tax=Candidatus Roizmaniibacteriota TaxID=1752723 RepID=A0A1F7INZ3_9BACT|nr:MAG: hypothetical protein A3D06_01840 [Candidatus Roizmanbacteria bacterium RIFCSPHIGHO2_02_FULL_40_9]OGK45080.1 MAG: hypothetical protein A2957_02170 [Candidatus Roizmanbacteria bacterium RIFCSPLOWO2_01_FULL_38_11]